MAANPGSRAVERPPWLPDSMDPESSLHLEIRIVTRNTRAPWFALDKVVDADVTNFTDLVTEVVNKYPHEYGHKVSLFYFCIERQLNIQVRNDQDLVDMFAKHKASKRCFLTFAYHSPTTEPPEIAAWDFSSSWESIEIPVTPSMPCPTIAPPSQSQSQSQTADDDEYLANPNPSNEHVGVDDEGLYLDLGPQQPPPPRKTLFQSSSKQRDVEGSDADTYCETESDDESDSDVDYDIEDVDEIIKDSEPDRMPDAEYDKKDPPMTVGTVYRDMNAFKLALASHAIKREFLYDIEKSDTGRYRVYCCGSIEGCKWRLHASVMKDGQSVKIKRNPYPHEKCHSSRRSGICKGATQFWVCEQVLDWLKEDATVGAKELQRRLKDEHKVLIPYRRVWRGKNLALDKLYGPWDKSFDNLYRLKAQLDETCPGSFFVIDHHTINNKIRFNRLFFALKPCVDGFLRGCRPYLAVDSTFLNGKFRGQLCVACAVDAHNWMYPVAVGVIDSETNENWVWFMERLKEAIGSPPGLTFCTDCGQAVMHGVSEVFPHAEHRECMYHLVQNFKKRYSGKVFDDHLWASSYSWSTYMFEKHYQAMAEAKPEAMKYLQENHKKLWTRSQYGTASKVDYVTNNLAESFNNWIKAEKAKHIDDLMDTIRQKLLIKWNTRKKVAKKFTGKIIPHIMKQVREGSFNLDIDVITEHDGVAELCAKGGSAFRFVVDLRNMTCTCRVWQGSGIPCKHAIAYITSIPGEKLEDHVDECYSVAKFKAAYEGAIPSIPDKSMWPKATHEFFMHPPLLKSTAGRRKNRYKGAVEGGSKRKSKKHECLICHQLGHHWYTCKNGDPADIAAMEADRGLPKKRQKKAAIATTETSIVVAPRGMVFPPNVAVQNAVHKKRKRKASSPSCVAKSKGAATSTSASTTTPLSDRSGTGSNEPIPLQCVVLAHFQEDAGVQTVAQEPSAATVWTPRRKIGIKKKLTPARGNKVPADPASPAANTRSKKQLLLE